MDDREGTVEIFSRLGIGTANWGKEYNGSKVSEKDQREILDLCMCKGIDLIDTATAYENNVLDIASSYFKIVDKGDAGEIRQKFSYAYLIHHFNYDTFYGLHKKLKHAKVEGDIQKLGVSLNHDPLGFDPEWFDIIQAPYSLFDREFEPRFPIWKNKDIEIHVRSIFLRGKVLEKVKPHEAIAFCLMNPYVDRVIMGVDSTDQFKENLDYFHWLDSLKVTDENILDPRRWKNE